MMRVKTQTRARVFKFQAAYGGEGMAKLINELTGSTKTVP